jgi:hypothetical protein
MATVPTGAWTLLEAAKYSSNLRKKGVITTLIQESPILEMLPFTDIHGNAVEIDVEATLPTVQFRNVNEGYDRSFGTDTKRMFGVAILGGEVFIDNFLLKTKANEINAKAKQWGKFAKAMSRQFDSSFFDGDGTAKDFKGVNQLISEGLGQSHPLASGGAALDLDHVDEAFDLFRSQASPDAILANRTVRRTFTSLARSTYSGYSLIDIGTDVFGRKVTEYNGVGIRIIGDDASGTAILGYDEDDGAANLDTCSIYLIAFGEDENVHGLSGAGGSMEVRDFGETEEFPGHLGRVEWYPGVAIANPFSVVRINRINA